MIIYSFLCKKLGRKVNKLHIVTCPLCSGNHLKPVMSCIDHFASGEQFEVWECVDCGFTFTQDVPVEAEIGRYYETPEYISHSDTEKGLMNKIYHVVRRFMLQRKVRLIERVSRLKSGRLLDIGTGTGYFPFTAQKSGWKVEAIEASEKARAFAKEHFHLDVQRDEAFETLADKTFDVITMWHVMEHIEHLNELWEQLHRLLKEQGVLVIAVPNHNSYDAKKYDSWWAAYDVPRHLWHFDPLVMKKMGEKHEFELAEQHPMPFDAFYVSMLTEKYKGSKQSFLKGLWTGCKGWLHALGDKEQSSSMIYVFRMK